MSDQKGPKFGKATSELYEYHKGQKAVRLTVTTASGTILCAEIAHFGAHVMSFSETDPSGKKTDLLWTTSKAVFDGSRAIRGGIPVIFPQFNQWGPLGSHGFARTSMWALVGVETDLEGLGIKATFRLTESKATSETWGAEKKFIFDYTVGLKADKDPGRMVIDSKISNTGSSEFGFTMALHSYFPVQDINSTIVSGFDSSFKGLKFIDSLQGLKDRAAMVVTETKDAIHFKEEVDRIYLNVPKKLQVVDKKANIAIMQETEFNDAIVWNPWVAKSKRMAKKDYNEDDYKKMVCVEVAEVGATGFAVVLKAGEICNRRVSIYKTELDSSRASL